MPADVQITRLLAFHLQRAVQINARALDVETQSHWLREALNLLTTGVVVLTHDLELVYANAAAEQMLRGATAARSERCGPKLAHESTSQPFALLASTLAGAALPVQDSAQITLSIARTAGARPLGVVVRSLGLQEAASHDATQALAVFINDPDVTKATPVGTLQDVYRLTPRETQFVELLARGLDLAGIAAASGITKETARSRLKSIFAKTGTHRQAELMHLVLQLSLDIHETPG